MVTTILLIALGAAVLYFGYWATKRTLAEESKGKKRSNARRRR
ncbi:MAG: hypothetical protein AAFQ83_19855 [Bacteroidota bacterium]